MISWDGLNRRRFPRIRYPCLVVIKNADEGKDIILTHTENIGIGGICVILKRNIKIFSPVELELDLMDLGDHIKCNGKIVWNVQRKIDAETKPLYHDIGIEFQNLKEANVQRVEAIIVRLAETNTDRP